MVVLCQNSDSHDIPKRRPTALGDVANTDTKFLICSLFQKSRVLAQDGVNRQQQDVIDYQQEENRVLRAGLRGKRLKLSDDDRRRLAVKAQALGREVSLHLPKGPTW